MRHILDTFGHCSGQSLNYSKLGIFFYKFVRGANRPIIKETRQMKKLSSDCNKYLEVLDHTALVKSSARLDPKPP